LLLHGFEASLTSLLTFPLPHQLPTEYANLTAKQQQLYDWHVRLGHMNYATIQSMARKDIGIPHTLATCSPPLCHDCQCGKAKCQSLKNLQPIGERPLRPGKMCCVNQMIASCPELPYMMRGRHSSHRYSTCTFFVDVATWFIFPHFQESTNAHETLLGKQRYEQFCRCYQHTVQEYCSDNGIFTDKDFTENLANTGQWHMVAGTGAHHMNGIVERSIGFISTWTLTSSYMHRLDGLKQSTSLSGPLLPITLSTSTSTATAVGMALQFRQLKNSPICPPLYNFRICILGDVLSTFWTNASKMATIHLPNGVHVPGLASTWATC